MFRKAQLCAKWVPKRSLGTREKYSSRHIWKPMPDWGEVFAAPEMQRLRPNPEFLAALPVIKAAGCRRVLDAGCGAGRHLQPLAREGFEVWSVDREAGVLQVLQEKLRESETRA